MIELTMDPETGKMSKDHDGHEQRMARYIRRAEAGLDIFTGEPYEHKEVDDDDDKWQ